MTSPSKFASLLVTAVLATACQQAAATAVVRGAGAIATVAGRGGSDVRAGNGVRQSKPRDWSRSFQTTAGRMVEPGILGDGDTLVVVWSTNIGVAKDGLVVGLMESTECVQRQRGPSLARARYGADATVETEIWKTGRRGEWEGGVIPAGQILGLFGDALAPSYVLFTPRKGDYSLDLVWKGTDIEALTAAAPCVTGWAGAEASAAALLTAGGAKKQEAEVIEEEAGPGEKESDELVLVRLHDSALNREFGGAQEGDEEADRSARKRAVARLLASGEGRKRLCAVTARYHLDARPLELWGGESTVTPAWKTRAGCARASVRRP